MTDVTIPPIQPQPQVMAFLQTRRSRPARTLGLPVPDRATVTAILTAAARVPDHGKLEPWRFLVLEKPALTRLAALALRRGAEQGLDEAAAAKGAAQFNEGFLTIAVVKRAVGTEKISEIEQLLSTGAVCLTVLNAAAAAGFGGNWLTGWLATDAAFCAEGLGLAPGEWVAGFVHLGSEGAVPPDRPRPDMARIVTWVSA